MLPRGTRFGGAIAASAALAAGLAACSSATSSSLPSSPPASTTAAAQASAAPAGPSEMDRLRSVVESYSDAYFGSDADTAYAILSPRCQTEIGRASYAQVVQQASAIYGALPIRSFSATVDGERALVSYGYDVTTLNQTDQSWQRQQGQWRYDSC